MKSLKWIRRFALRNRSLLLIHFIGWIGLTVLFQNCTYQGRLFLTNDPSSLNLRADYGGNGGTYEGKLTFVLHHKGQVIDGNSITLVSGEQFSFEIKGGTAPYTMSLQGPGHLDPVLNLFTAAFLASPQNSQIEVQDSVGARGQIFIQAISFSPLSKIPFPFQGAPMALSEPQVIPSASGTLYSLTRATDHQFTTSTLLRRSRDGGIQWMDLKTVRGTAHLLEVAPLPGQGSPLLYLTTQTTTSPAEVWFSEDEGQN